MRVLHCGMWRLGVASGAVLPELPAVGHAGAQRACAWRHSDRLSRLLFLRHRYEHCCAYIALRFC